MDVVVGLGPSQSQCAAGVVVFFNSVFASLVPLAESIHTGTCRYLTAIDDDVAAYAIMTLLVVIAATYARSVEESSI